jgi:photosystem II stability/assembly factor-like uncharacterized protein
MFAKKTVVAILSAFMLSACAQKPTALSVVKLAPGAQWKKLDTVAFRGKQDDIYFVNEQLGFYVNGDGKIYRTRDAGASWKEIANKPGTYFRTIAFIDEKRGFAGNVGTDYFPDVKDETPLYETHDGGDTWSAVTSIDGPKVKGLCAIDITRTQFINAGNLESRTMIHAGGRVGGPAFLMRSMDAGKTWRAIDISAHTAMVLDVKFFDENVGIVMGASDSNSATSNAKIIMTRDGGATWKTVFQSNRLFEITWKASFPTRDTGYVTIQNYDQDKSNSQRYVAKTTDGGLTWAEVKLVDLHVVRQFGVAFADEKSGWVGTTNGGYQTEDGGATWKHVEALGRYVNKLRIVKRDALGGNGFDAYAIGADVRKWRND